MKGQRLSSSRERTRQGDSVSLAAHLAAAGENLVHVDVVSRASPKRGSRFAERSLAFV